MAAEGALEAALRRRGLCARVVSEERGERTVGPGETAGTLLYDPVDGSNNMLRRIPYYATSLAWIPRGRPERQSGVQEAVVLDIPGLELYRARRGEGARMGTRLLETRRPGPRLSKPLVALYAYGVRRELPGVRPLMARSLVRTLGAISLDLCLLARGALDAVVDVRGLLRSFDVAAGVLIAREAGCAVAGLDGEPLDPEARAKGFHLVAARGREMQRSILRMLRGGRSG